MSRTNLGRNRVPDSVERRVEDAVDGLRRDVLNAALRKGKGILEVVRTVEELGMVVRETVRQFLKLCELYKCPQDIIFLGNNFTKKE